MQIFRRKKGDQSGQRKMQRMIDQPLVVSYSKDFELAQEYKNSDQSFADTRHHNQTAQYLPQDTNYKLRHSDIFKSLVYAFGQKQILVRVQNMQDTFDGPGDALTFDVEHFAKTLYKQANPGYSDGQIELLPLSIEETTLTGMQNYEKTLESDTQWKTNESMAMVQKLKQRPEDKVSLTQNGTKHLIATLEPQRIRAFKVTYNV